MFSEASPAIKSPDPELKIVTIVFADFAGFTTFVRKQDPEEVHGWLKSVWRDVDAVISAYGGSVVKHIGDAVMAFFGERGAREDAPAQAVRAARAIQAHLAALQRQGPQPPLLLRIGIHSGPVVLESRSPSGEFAATGAAINLASRLEQSAPPGKVLISQAVFRSVYGLFDLSPVEPLSVKGILERVKAYVVGPAKPRAVSRQLRDIEGVSTEMIGRKQELRLLQSAFQRVLRQGRAELVTILGEPGIGKSRLLQEFQRWAELLPERFWFFLGQATADMPSMPFALIRDVFASRFELLESDPPAVAREKLETGILTMLSNCPAASTWSGHELRQTAHFVGHLLGLDFSHSPHLRDLLGDPQQLRHRAFLAFRRFFSVLGESAKGNEGPLGVKGILLVAEDIHWGDQGSLDMLEDLSRGCQTIPMLIVCLARPALYERRPSWCKDLRAHTRVVLEALTPEESRALVKTILRKAPAVPTALRDLVTNLADGNPFYIEELIKMLIDQQVIRIGADRWVIEGCRLASARVPQTLAGVLQARLAGLPPAERTLLQCAAVVGRVFWDRALEAVGEQASVSAVSAAGNGHLLRPDEVAGALQALCRKDLVLRRGASSFERATEYAFHHELLRVAAYESLLTRIRRELHARVASWLIGQSGERSAELAGQVATHFECAGLQTEAADWYARAGKQARSGQDPRAAIDYLIKAVALLPEGRREQEPKRLRWLCSLMDTLSDQARFKEAGKLIVEIRRRAERNGDLISQARAWNGLAFLCERRADNHASISAARKAETLARKTGTEGVQELLRALHFRGWALYRLGRWPAVLELSRETQRLCRRFHNRNGMAASLKLQGVVHLQRGEGRKADKCFKEGLRLCKEAGDRRNAAAMLSNLGENARLRGEFAAAVDYYERALTVTRQIGNRESELVYLSNLSGARIGLGQFAEAEATLRQVIPLATTRTSSMLSEAFSFLAEACLRQGKHQEALGAARRALDLGRESGNALDTAIAWRALGEVAAQCHPSRNKRISSRHHQRTDPARCYSLGLLLFKKIHAEAEQARTLRAWARFELARGRGAEAKRKNGAAMKIFRRLRMRREIDATTSTFIR